MGDLRDDISGASALRWPAILLVAMLVIAAGLSLHTGVDGSRVFMPYIGAWAALTLIAALVRLFVEVAKLAPKRADRPLRQAFSTILDRHQLFLISALIFPAFLGAYTWAKSSIPFVVGYPFERFWADVDKTALGSDGWQLAHALSGPSLALAWTYFYAVVWGLCLALSGPTVAIFAKRRVAATFFTAMMLSWLLGGVVLAYLLSAAGPVFAHLADPGMVGRFQPLRSELLHLLGPDNIVLKTQRILATTMESPVAIKGGGISAMPSMHIATATTLLLAARRTIWKYAAILFLLMTFFGSVYLGYHYAVDAPVAVGVAVACWWLANRLHEASGAEPMHVEHAPA
jgi:hypothetical protein